MTKRFALKTVNKQLPKNVELVKGDGYHYFVYDDGDKIFETESVMEHFLTNMPLERWVTDGKNFANKVEEKYRNSDR